MEIETTAGRMSILAPAKLNLFLEVLGKRSDGFHQIETVLCPISLFDRVTVEVTEDPPIFLDGIVANRQRIAVSADSKIYLNVVLPPNASSANTNRRLGDPAWDVPATEANLVVRAAELVRQQLGTSKGCRIRLEKQIPSAAGLGGGSSDAAATVVACLHLWDSWDRELATSVCTKLGSDIPFFLGEIDRIGLALGTERGEQCVFPSCKPTLEFIVMHPPVGCSTGDVYASYRSQARPRDARKILTACETGQLQKIGAELFNALQFPVRRINTWVDCQLDLLSSCGFTYALMTGSGSSCFALMNSEADLSKLRSLAMQKGISRVYSTVAWYAPSIEQQLASASN